MVKDMVIFKFLGVDFVSGNVAENLRKIGVEKIYLQQKRVLFSKNYAQEKNFLIFFWRLENDDG